MSDNSKLIYYLMKNGNFNLDSHNNNIKTIFYKQFICGENLEEIKRKIYTLKAKNIGSILDYSVEQNLYNSSRFKNYDQITNKYIENILYSKNHGLKIIAIKLSSLTNPEEIVNNNFGSDFYRRIKKICDTAYFLDIKITIDAEQTYLQKNISNLTLELMKVYNKLRPIIYNTYQSYLKDCFTLYLQHKKYAQRNNFYFAYKLVRGAYMDLEDKKILNSKNHTTTVFNKILLDSFLNENIHVIIATHNEFTIKYSLKLMKKYKNYSFWFAQLYGTSDYLTDYLASKNYNVFKYIPYGNLQETLPYIQRRILELYT